MAYNKFTVQSVIKAFNLELIENEFLFENSIMTHAKLDGYLE